MSKLLKSKFLLGVMTVAIMFVGVVAVSTTASADCTVVATVRVGSSGANVMCVQTIVGATADGSFGPLTKAAVMAWQSGHALTADGVVGPLTAAAMNAGGAVSGNFPVGCSSASGYSTVTGLACTSLASNGPCSGGALFNSATGASCSASLPAGCTQTSAFSSTTGLSCTSTPAPVSSTGEGSITLDYAAIPAANVVINKGQADQNAAAITVKATGSDMKVSRVWLDFTGFRPWLAADTATLKDGSTVLGTVALSASAFTEVTAGSKWELQFNNLNVVVPVGTTKTLMLTLGRPTLTQTYGTLTIATTSSVRATDMAGFSNTYTMASRAISLPTTAATTGSLTVSTNLNSPAAQSIGGLSTTAGVLTAVKLGDFDFKATDAAVNITTVEADLSGGTIANEVASVELRDGTNVLSSVTAGADNTFASLNINVAQGTTKTLSIWAQMNPARATAGAGYVLKGQGITASIDSSETVATDTAFNTVTVTSADASGNAQYMFQYAPTITLGTHTGVAVVGDATGEQAGNYTLSFTVTAPSDSNIYVNATDGLLCGGTYPMFKTGNSASDCTATTIGATLSTTLSVSGTSSKGTGTLSTWDKVAAGSSRTFTVTGYILDGGSAGFTAMSMVSNGLQWTDTDGIVISGCAAAGLCAVQTWGITDFHTDPVYISAS